MPLAVCRAAAEQGISMFAWIIGASLRFRFLVLAIAVALLVFGGQQLRRMPVDVFPEFAPPKVEIQTEGPGMTSTEVEELITIPMEDQLRGVPGVEYVRSSSVVGLSQIVLLFKMGTDLMEARQRVQERVKLAIAELPQSSGMPVMLQPLSSTSRVMKIGLSSKVHDMMDLSMIAYWTIKFRLHVGPGRRQHSHLGRPHQVAAGAGRSEPDARPRRHARRGHGDDLGRARLRPAAYTPAAKTRIDGMLDTPNQRCVIHNESPVFSAEHLAAVPLALKGKRADPPRLRDVGERDLGHLADGRRRRHQRRASA